MYSVSRRGFLAASALTAAAQAPSDVIDVKAPRRRNRLSQSWSPEKLRPVILPPGRWRPFPTLEDRAGWDAVSSSQKQKTIASAANSLGAQWPSLTASLFLDFVRNGNRSRYEEVASARRLRLHNQVLAECMENRGRFLDDIANGVWLVCEETYWGYPAHVGIQKQGAGLPDVNEPTIDLFAAETAAQLAWTTYLLGAALDRVHPLLRSRIAVEVERRILAPYRTRDDFWWMGLQSDRPVNNWNPWINSNCLACALLLEEDQKRRSEFVYKVLLSLDRFLDAYSEDGGCDEGPSYWGRAGGSLFDNLDLLHSASAGAVDFFGLPLVGEIGRYIYRANIHDDWFVNFADASARVSTPGVLVYRYGKSIRDPKLQSFGAWAARKQLEEDDEQSLGRSLFVLVEANEIRSATARQPLVRDVWLPGVQVMAARRKEGSAEGLYLAAQGGHNAESHNHNDVGNFILYAGGEPAVIDVGVETYTAKTFSAQRYEIWTMQSAYHNCPTVNGVMQAPGRRFEARDVEYSANDREVVFRLGLAAAYPSEAGVESWRRDLHFDRERNRLELRDVWKLRSPAPVWLTLMTPCEVAVDDGVLRLRGGKLTHSAVSIAFDPRLFAAVVEPLKIEDLRLRRVWGDRLYRILLKSTSDRVAAESLLAFTEA